MSPDTIIYEVDIICGDSGRIDKYKHNGCGITYD